MKLSSITLILFLAILIPGCKKDPPIISSSLADFFRENGVPEQHFAVDVSSYSYILTGQNVYISIDSAAFVNDSGQIVTGIVDIVIREITTKKDMILSGIFPVSGGKPLISGGEFHIEAFKNGQPLKLRQPEAVFLNINGYDPIPSYNFREFYATNLTENTNWGEPEDTVGVYWTGIGTGYVYSFGLDSLNWINCDYFYNSLLPGTIVKAFVNGDQFDENNTRVFISFDTLNSSSMCYFHGDSIYSPGLAYNVPIGMPVTWVAIAKANGNYYSFFHQTSLASDHIEEISLTPTTLEEFKVRLNDL